jgi:hypothetical protein
VSDDVVLYGLRIRSDVAVHQGRSVPRQGDADLEVTVGPGMVASDERPAGVVLAHDELSPEAWYCFVREESGAYILRYASVCDFLVSADLRHVVVRIVEGADPEMVSVFTAGAVPAFALIMGGEAVLHASAVDVGGRVVAFVGQSGMGKSTMAALVCAAGGRLVTDDVLRLETTGSPRCYLGGGELRLRRSSDDVTDGFDARPESRRTGDGRNALKVSSAGSELLPLAAIVIPFPDRAATELWLRRLDPVRAVLGLASFPRFVGWEDPTTQAEQFQYLGDICDSVPVYTAQVPWGPPFPTDLVETILTGAGIDHSLPLR